MKKSSFYNDVIILIGLLSFVREARSMEWYFNWRNVEDASARLEEREGENSLFQDKEPRIQAESGTIPGAGKEEETVSWKNIQEPAHELDDLVYNLALADRVARMNDNSMRNYGRAHQWILRRNPSLVKSLRFQENVNSFRKHVLENDVSGESNPVRPKRKVQKKQKRNPRPKRANDMASRSFFRTKVPPNQILREQNQNQNHPWSRLGRDPGAWKWYSSEPSNHYAGRYSTYIRTSTGQIVKV